MNKSLVRTAMCGCAGVVAAGCLQDQRPAQQPELALVDSVVLQQSASEYVGLPSGFAVLPGEDGFLVSDLRNRTVHRFGRDGTHQEQLGREGEGPGEFSAPPTALALDGDSILFVRTGWAGLQVIDLRARTFRDPRELPGTAHVIAASNGRVYFRLVDPETRTSSSCSRHICRCSGAGSGDRNRGGLHRRRRLRPLLLGSGRRRTMDRAAGRGLAGVRLHLRTGVLGPASGVHLRHAGRGDRDRR